MQKQVGHRVALSESMLKDKLQEVKGAVMMCYPMGLPQFDPMRMILDGQDGGPAAVRFGVFDFMAVLLGCILQVDGVTLIAVWHR